MQQLSFLTKPDRPLKILFIGAHSDDIELGCGATLLGMLRKNYGLEVTWVVLSASPERRREAEKSAQMFLKNAVKHEILVQDFKESFFPYVASEIKECFEGLKRKVLPDVIFTHYHRDLHQDHRLTSELTWNTFRNHLILEYEIVKYDGDLGSPNVFVHASEEACVEKIRFLLDNFHTQRSHHWFTEDTFRAIMRLRGIESNAPSGYAEGFYARKIVVI